MTARRMVLRSALLLAAGLAAGAATASDDPLEGVNRTVSRFNDHADRLLLKPLAQGYTAAVPFGARVMVSNFFGNLRDIPTALNDALQGKFGDAATDVGRIVVNSTLGIVGVIDVASEMGLRKNKEDFGQTLGAWGVPAGPYLVLPLLGPSTVRDTAALPVDYWTAGIVLTTQSIPVRNSLAGLRVVDERASLLGSDTALDEAAIDRYVFLRSFYLQRRDMQVRDAEDAPPVRERFDDEAEQAPAAAPAP